ncbi:MAG: cytochrome c oxidase subunit II [Desulfurococcales archaeon]|nr:cytochrome c oxidase subunit II [Desulfurococcales archaeon]
MAGIVPPQEYWWMLFKYYLLAAFVLAGGVTALLVYFFSKYRASSEDEFAEDYPGPGRVPTGFAKIGATKYMLVVTGIIVLGLTIATFPYTEYVELTPSSPDIVIWVTGYTFGWRFEYPPDLGGFTTINEVVLPTDTVVEFKVTSDDVFHAFGIPEFKGAKVDAIKGIVNSLWIKTPSQPGEYDIFCYELCGVGHSLMKAKLKIVTPEEFKEFIESKR